VQASPLPPAASNAECATFAGSIDNPTFCQTDTDCAEMTLAPFAGTHATAICPASFDIANVGGLARLIYSWMVEGPRNGVIVPVKIAVNVSASSFGGVGAFGFASVTVGTSQSGSVQACVTTQILGCSGATGFDGVISVNAVSGEVESINIEAEAGGTFSENVNGGEAFADPMFFIDPTFADAGEFHIVLSDGVANARAEDVALPEPATLALLGLGLIGFGAVRWRR